MTMPEGFIWGAATSSYQIEGGAEAHGKGPSVWDDFCTRPGVIRDGSDGLTACDHTTSYIEDVRLMKELGLHAYRLSISWPRVMPDGIGAVSEAGLAFYDRLVDEMLASGVDPHVTLFHWDYPLALQHSGAWLNPASPEWFNEYAAAVVARLSDRVSNWMTINEPQVFIALGHGNGTHAPGLQLPIADQVRIAHHVLVAHGMAARTIRESARTKPVVGWAPVGHVFIPKSDSEEDVAAARRATFSVDEDSVWNNTWHNDPVYLGQYPEDGLERFGRFLPEGWERDLERIHQPMDFFGCNIYQGEVIRARRDGEAESVAHPVGNPRTLMGWNVTPRALYWGPRFFYERYKLPIMITENGVSNLDRVMSDGQVHDPQRIDYTARHLRELRRASEDGVKVKGYFHWSLLDNFEWAEGYTQRFGLIHVDFDTKKRVPKDSFDWYREVIRSNGATLDQQSVAAALGGAK